MTSEALIAPERERKVLFQPQAISFDIIKDDIERLRAEYGTLTVRDENDKEGFAVVHAARMDMRSLRTGVDKRRKELKADSNKYNKMVEEASRELMELLLPIEDHLLKQEAIVTEAAERKKQAELEKRAALIRTRLAALRACEYPGSITYRAESIDVHQSSEDFNSLLMLAQAEKEEYEARVAAEKAEQARVAAEQKLEREKLDAERAELDKQKEAASLRVQLMSTRLRLLASNEFKHDISPEVLADLPNADWEGLLEQARKERAERDRIAAEKEAVEQRQRDELAARRVAELAKYGKSFGDTTPLGVVSEAEYQKYLDIAKQEHAQAEQHKAACEEAERKRLASLKPDYDKIMEYASALDGMKALIPELSEDIGAKSSEHQIRAVVTDCANTVREIGNEFLKVRER